MRTKEVEKAIKVMQKDIKDYKAELEIELEDRIDEQRIAYLHQQTTSYETVLAYIEKLEKENKFLRDENNIYRNETVGKKRIRDKIKELEELNFNNYANEYDNGNEVKYYILKEFKEIIGE